MQEAGAPETNKKLNDTPDKLDADLPVEDHQFGEDQPAAAQGNAIDGKEEAAKDIYAVNN